MVKCLIDKTSTAIVSTYFNMYKWLSDHVWNINVVMIVSTVCIQGYVGYIK